ncbi:Bacteriophage tail assembly protein [Morganella morganii]|nr:Bacteriophage tail assembly protein [Morganella morganii]
MDTGGESGVTDNAYAFWRQCRRDGISRKVFLFKGGSRTGAKLITKSYPDNTGRSDRQAKAAGDVPLYLLQTDNLKDRVAAALSRDMPGPNYVHFPDWLDDSFYDELTYEERLTSGKWEKPGRGANEAFDLMVYAHALVIIKGYEKIKWDKPPPWARLPDIPVIPPENTDSPDNITLISTTGSAKPKKPKKRKASAWAPVSSSGGGWI